MWSRLIALGVLALQAYSRMLPSFDHTDWHATHEARDGLTLGDAFAALSASDVDASAAHAFVRTGMDALSVENYMTLAHPAYPRHSLRVKKSRFCDGGVDAYTGYVDVEARHIFFYFFKSRGDWENDDVIFVRDSISLGGCLADVRIVDDRRTRMLVSSQPFHGARSVPFTLEL
jgi:hypothetical protein